MGSGSSTTYTPRDGQFIFFNNHRHNRNRPMSFNEEQLLDPTGIKTTERCKLRMEYLKNKKKHDKILCRY
jgi:hypothetical protein